LTYFDSITIGKLIDVI